MPAKAYRGYSTSLRKETVRFTPSGVAAVKKVPWVWPVRSRACSSGETKTWPMCFSVIGPVGWRAIRPMLASRRNTLPRGPRSMLAKTWVKKSRDTVAKIMPPNRPSGRLMRRARTMTHFLSTRLIWGLEITRPAMGSSRNRWKWGRSARLSRAAGSTPLP